ncbi:MAG: zinc/iron-chelating domain-containing protein [Spirochaetales bacterium]|nr:MAG: zinc/iron-chelating domain-containing protein [Spirochaetales bacterium]
MNSETETFWHKGLNFSCVSCGHCCRHDPGYVFLTQNDLTSLAEHVQMTESEFIQKYCKKVNLGITSRLSLEEKDNYDCIFWDGGCTVYAARPRQCRSYPFWPAVLANRAEWDREAEECPGMNKGCFHSKEAIEAVLADRAEELFINPDKIS